ncbi:unnamed protein product, partial [Vitis vinifera]|uniref:Uncharacterized protein n=1 Tax=Vitis vinifera TaxID=29760 RepID=D7TXE7_VITVI
MNHRIKYFNCLIHFRLQTVSIHQCIVGDYIRLHTSYNHHVDYIMSFRDLSFFTDPLIRVVKVAVSSSATKSHISFSFLDGRSFAFCIASISYSDCTSIIQKYCNASIWELWRLP